jgi:diguanylate cyclase (GGDEF)-like protein/PAS domain S-box-containing protein
MKLNDIKQDELIYKNFESKMQEGKELKNLFENITNIAIFATDENRRVVQWNRASEKLFGYSKIEVLGKKIEELIIPEHLVDHYKDEFIEFLNDSKNITNSEIEYRRRNNSLVLVNSNSTYITTKDKKRLVFTFNIDISLTKKPTSIKSIINDKLIENTKMIVISFNRNLTINEFNKPAQELMGYTKEEVENVNFVDMFVPDSYKEKVKEQIEDSFRQKKSLIKLDFPLICKQGEKKVIHWDNALMTKVYKHDSAILLVGTDEKRYNRSQEKLEYLANFDQLTDLPNKNLLLEKIQNSINKSARSNRKMITVFLSITNFKSINSTFGYTFGDKLLKSMSKRLYSKLRDYDTIARFGGDEFVILFEDVGDELSAGKLAQRIEDLFCEPFHIDKHELFLNVNMGISFFPSDANDAKGLIKNASMAMNKAKESKEFTYQFFKPQMNEQLTRRVILETHLRNAIKNREFFLQYQPLVDAKTKKVIGAEALVRWNHPKLKTIPPLDFIPIAEDTGMILEIGKIVLEDSIKQMKAWHDMGYDDINISVNISAVQLLQSNLLDTVDKIVEKNSFNPKLLELEITESSLITNIEVARNVLNRFKEKGIKTSIDDFGTGYSSFSYLTELPIDILKIDGSFIRKLNSSKKDKTIVNAIIAMAHELDLQVIAEWVENEEQYNYLLSQNCDIIQGIYFKEPLDAQEFEDILKNDREIELKKDLQHNFNFKLEEELKRYTTPINS